MPTVTITRTIEAEQWIEGGPLPKGAFECFPEVEWSAGRELIYFTYAEFMPRDWLGVAQLPPPDGAPKTEGLESIVVYTPASGAPYARKVLPFTFWSVKSESSIKRDWRAVYVDGDDDAVLKLWNDYRLSQQWPNPMPRRIEYRETDGAYGRGFRPIYMKPSDWLLREPIPDGHNNLGTKQSIRVVSDDEFKKLAA